MATANNSSRAAETRERLLKAAIDVFGRSGFAGASTRDLASAAGVNLQAITYYFGGKDGLYLAAADHLAEMLEGQLGPSATLVLARLADKTSAPIEAEEARRLLGEMLCGVTGILFDETWTPLARFVVREQMDPTEAFDRIYEKLLEPVLAIARRLVAVVLGEDPRSQRVRLRTLSLVGSVVFFRIAHATATRQLGWKRAGPRERAALRELIQEIVDTLGASGERAP